MKRLLTVAVLSQACLSPVAAPAHDFWSNGEPVPAWAKSWCCGQSDVHRLDPGAVHILPDGYHIDGLTTVIPLSRAIPSPDGYYWAFFRNDNLPDSSIYCFYAPLNGV